MDRPAWRTSSYTSNGASCVEVAPGPDGVRVRDTKDRGAGPTLLVTLDEFAGLRLAAETRRPGATGTLVVDHDERLTVHNNADVVTSWHVRRGTVTLHFTDREWAAFAAGVRDGEFTFAGTT